MTATHDMGDAHGVPDWKLERYILGELPADELERLGRQIDADAGLRRRAEILRAEGAEVLAAYPPAWMARQIERRGAGAAAPGVAHRTSRWHLRWPVPVAAAALLAVAAIPLLRSQPGDSPISGAASPMLAAKARGLTEDARGLTEDGVRIKGTGARLFVHRKTPQGTERLADGAAARRGDLIRLQYDAAGATHGVILSIDGRGAVTRHLPLAGAAAARLSPGGTVSLATAYELDDAPRWERFFLVTADHDFALDPVLASAAAAAAAARDALPDALVLPAGLDQTAVTLTKVEPPR